VDNKTETAQQEECSMPMKNLLEAGDTVNLSHQNKRISLFNSEEGQ
jgi:hypothetical protein